MEGKEKKNILLVIDSLFGAGAELVVSNLCKHLNRDLFNVSACCLREIGERGEELSKMGYDIIGLPKLRWIKNKYLSFLRLANLVMQKEIDLIHSHSTQGLVDSALCKILNRKIKHIHTFHFGNYPHLDKKAFLLEKSFSNFPDKLIAVGKEQEQTIKKSYRLNNKKILTVWNGVEIDNSGRENRKSIQSFYPKSKETIIGSISTLTEQKGLTFLLDAVSILNRRMNNFKVWIVGDGPLKAELEEKSAALGLKGVVEFIGWVHNAPSVVFPKIDIFVQSSLWEAMSMVVLEAMAASKAIIVTDVGDNRHIIENGKDGIIVKKKDITDMAEKMEKLILNKFLRKKLGQRAREKAIRECSVSQMTQNYERLYLEVLGVKR